MAERLKAADCKSVPSGTQVRILPLPFSIKNYHLFLYEKGDSLVVKYGPEKARM